MPILLVMSVMPCRAINADPVSDAGHALSCLNTGLSVMSVTLVSPLLSSRDLTVRLTWVQRDHRVFQGDPTRPQRAPDMTLT